MEQEQKPQPQTKVKIEVQTKIIKLINGDDIVCDLPIGKNQLPEANSLLRIVKPLQIRYVPQLTPMGVKDYIALIKWTGYSNDHVVTIPKDKIMTITNATPDMLNSYKKLVIDYNKLDIPSKWINETYKNIKVDKKQMIIDYISGMTDRYASRLYSSIYE